MRCTFNSHVGCPLVAGGQRDHSRWNHVRIVGRVLLWERGRWGGHGERRLEKGRWRGGLHSEDGAGWGTWGVGGGGGGVVGDVGAGR